MLFISQSPFTICHGSRKLASRIEILILDASLRWHDSEGDLSRAPYKVFHF
ncbi:MAG: hypothetical protein HY559_04130 [Gammaproteobacteria bacterium]|nr:hypothetical protein [Gammaproteobacteria bacterium]